MPTVVRTVKSVVSGPEGAAVLRAQVERGISALQTALGSLVLSEKERASLLSIVAAQSQRALLLRAQVPARVGKAGGAHVASKAVPVTATTPKTKKQLQSETAKRLRMLQAKRQAEIREVHRKSGYSDYLRKAPGSFERGKK